MSTTHVHDTLSQHRERIDWPVFPSPYDAESKESSKARVALAAAAGVVVGFGIGYTLQAYRHDDKRNVGVDEDHKLHQKIMSLRNQLINAEKVMDEMITDLKMRVDNVMGSHGTDNSCATINSSKNEYLTYLLSRLKKKLARTLSGFEKVSRQDSGLKSQLLECQKVNFKRLESLPIGHTEFSWNGSKWSKCFTIYGRTHVDRAYDGETDRFS